MRNIPNVLTGFGPLKSLKSSKLSTLPPFDIVKRRRGEDRPKGKVIGWRATVVRAKAEATGSEEGKEDGYSRSNEITFSP